MPTIVAPACRPGESRRADLWRGCASLWAPCLKRFSLGTSFSTREQAIPDLGLAQQGIRKSGGGTVGVNPFGYGLALSGAGGGFLVVNGSLTNFNFIHQSAVFSLVAVVKTDTNAAFMVLLDSVLGSSSNTGFILYKDSAGKINCQVTRASAGNYVVNGITASAMSLSSWTTIVVTCDGNTQRMWLNGRRNGTDASVGTLGSGDASQTLGVGCYGGGVNTNVWAGQIAYAGIWNRALSGRDARALAADPFGMFRRRRQTPGRAAGFRCWYAHHGTLVGGSV